jgi:hypothetical protein
MFISRCADLARCVTESAVRIVLERRFDPSFGARRSEVQKDMNGNHQQPRLPSEKQKAILRLLAAAERPMRSAELQRRAGLLTGEFRGAIYWLRDNGYIVGVVKTIKTFGIGLANNRKAFWSILPKGRETLEPPLPEQRADPLGIGSRRRVVDHHTEVGPTVDGEGRIFERD